MKHQYSSTHDQLNEEWIKKTTDKEKNILKKWRGFLGNSYLKEIKWGKKVYLKIQKYIFYLNHLVKQSQTAISFKHSAMLQ